MADTRPVDVDAAWRWVVALRPGPLADAGGLRVVDPAGNVVFTADGEGRWTTTAAVTPEARDLFDLFVPLRVRHRFVVAQMGQSLDGRIATESGHSHYINGPADIRRLHRLRALVDAVVVGAGTVAADDPRLTVREVPGDDPARVVLDPRGRLDPSSRLFRGDGVPVLWIRGPDAPRPGRSTRDDRGAVEIATLPVEGERGFDPHAVVELLGRRRWTRILIEGGGITVSRFVAVGAVDRLHVSVAPLILGSGRPSFTLPPVARLEEGLRPPVRHFRLGSDLLFDLDLSSLRR